MVKVVSNVKTAAAEIVEVLHKNKIPLALIPTVYENVEQLIQKYTIPCGAWSTATPAAPETLTLRASEMNPYPHGHPMFMSHGTPITDEEAKAWKENFLKECAEKRFSSRDESIPSMQWMRITRW
jgi:hypothetical protein